MAPQLQLLSQPIRRSKRIVEQINASTSSKPVNQEDDYKRGWNLITGNIVINPIPREKNMGFRHCKCAGKGWDCSSNNDCKNRKGWQECPKTCKVTNCKNQRFSHMEEKKYGVVYFGKKGWGVKAIADILNDELLGEFCGEVILASKCGRRNLDHAFAVDKYRFDAKHHGTEFRFLNHSCSPNAQCLLWRVPGTSGNIYRLGIFAIKDIAKGEEITVDYGENAFGGASSCLCRTENCRFPAVTIDDLVDKELIEKIENLVAEEAKTVDEFIKEVEKLVLKEEKEKAVSKRKIVEETSDALPSTSSSSQKSSSLPVKRARLADVEVTSIDDIPSSSNPPRETTPMPILEKQLNSDLRPSSSNPSRKTTPMPILEKELNSDFRPSSSNPSREATPMPTLEKELSNFRRSSYSRNSPAPILEKQVTSNEIVQNSINNNFRRRSGAGKYELRNITNKPGNVVAGKRQ